MKSTIVKFLSTSVNPGTESSAQTGDALTAIIIGLVLICLAVAGFVFFKKAHINSFASNAKNANLAASILRINVVIAGLFVALFLLIFGSMYFWQTAYAANEDALNYDVSSSVNGYVNESTGEVDFDSITLVNHEDATVTISKLNLTKAAQADDGDCDWIISSDENILYEGPVADSDVELEQAIELIPNVPVELNLACDMEKEYAVNLINKDVFVIYYDATIDGTSLNWDEETSNIANVYDEADNVIANHSNVEPGVKLFVETKNIVKPNCSFTIENSEGLTTKEFPIDSVTFNMPSYDTDIYATQIDKEFYAKLDHINGILNFYYDVPHEASFSQKDFDLDFHSESASDEAWPYQQYSSKITEVSFDPSVANFYGFKSTCSMFYFLNHVDTISGFEYLQTENVTDMSFMFDYFACWEPTYNQVPNVAGWNTSKVKNMAFMFAHYGSGLGLTQLALVPNVGSWDTTNVADMSNMFSDYGGYSLKLNDVPDVSNWVTSSVVDMSRMFASYGGNSTILNCVPNVSSWDTRSVEDFEEMFIDYAFSSPEINCAPNISGWDVSGASNLWDLFFEFGRSSNNTFSVDMSTWEITSDLDLAGMFQDSHFAEFKIGPKWINSVSNAFYDGGATKWNMDGDTSKIYTSEEIDGMISSGLITQTATFTLAVG